ncbi:MAG: hypothetical protein GVY21_06440 [Gammaproteobacteria bacterium]|nr:hypothetical protein [Gammaproteobacteria bacterium]
MSDDRELDTDRELAGALGRLPQYPPPVGAWQAIRQCAEREGLLKPPRRRRPFRDFEWLAVGAVAATVVVGVMIALLDLPLSGTSPGGEPVPADEAGFAATPAENDASLGSLMARSRLLEEALRAAPETPRVMRASTAGTIATLEDRIAMIDQQLSFPERPLTEAESTALWRERVRLMDSLVQLRYAQARRVVL